MIDTVGRCYIEKFLNDPSPRSFDLIKSSESGDEVVRFARHVYFFPSLLDRISDNNVLKYYYYYYYYYNSALTVYGPQRSFYGPIKTINKSNTIFWRWVTVIWLSQSPDYCIEMVKKRNSFYVFPYGDHRT